MAEAIILPLAKSIVARIAHFTGNLVYTSVSEEIKAARSAKNDLEIIADKMEAIYAVLEDADKKQYINRTIKIWLRDLKSLAYGIDDLLDEVQFDALVRRVNEGDLYHRLRYHLSFSNPIFARFPLSRKIKVIRLNLENVIQKKNEFGLTERPVEGSRDEIRDPLDQCTYVSLDAVGRDEAKQDIINIVLDASCYSRSTEPCVLPITGMGGIGKTTLAKLVYRDVSHFDLKLWACVSDKFQIPQIIESILKNVGYLHTSNQSLEILMSCLQQLLHGKKYFLVLDDVWEHEPRTWVDFKSIFTNGIAGNTILITTREANVASITQTIGQYNVAKLPTNVCWWIFHQLVFREGDERRYANLYHIGWSIVEKCRGVPVLVKSLASLLASERDEGEWHRINNMASFTELDEQYKTVLEVLRLSYDKLPSHLKPLFAYMSLLVKDTIISLDIKYMWSAHSLLQLRNGNNEFHSHAYSYIKELASRSLIQEPGLEIEGVEYRFKMHDLLHDLAVSIMGEELAIVTSEKLEVSRFTKHIVWGNEIDNGFSYEEFPEELLKAKKIRTFRFGYITNQQISQSFLERIISNFICLRILDLGYTLFEELPSIIGNLRHLRYLSLCYNHIIKSLPSTICKLLNLETLLLQGCIQLEGLPRDLHYLQDLKCFCMTTKMSSVSSTRFDELCSLQSLGFQSCERLVSLWDYGNAGRLTSLQSLSIFNCPALTCLPNSINSLTCLEVLVIVGCENLNLQRPEDLQGLVSLRSLKISGVPTLTRLPSGLISASSSLQHLKIFNCENLTRLPKWLGHFCSIRLIRIGRCPNLLALPKKFCNLTSLEKLSIWECPHLSKRCAVPTGKDYTLIQKVPKFKLDGVYYTPHQYH